TSVGSVYKPKLMGTYELELHPIIEQLCKQQFNRIIDVGAAEGYYAVGMAIRSPASEVIAFETTAEGQALIAELAELNEVKARVEVRGHCGLESLRNALPPEQHNLVII